MKTIDPSRQGGIVKREGEVLSEQGQLYLFSVLFIVEFYRILVISHVLFTFYSTIADQ